MNVYKLPIILGPTAVGKTEIAIHLAEEIGGEILSCDSRQVYREMDIGTSKPDLEEQKRIKHHLIDLVLPDVHYSSGEYARDARKLLNSAFSIHPELDSGSAFNNQQSKIPLLVGGSGLYIRALINGFFDAPPIDLKIRKRLEEEDLHTLYERLKKVDPQSAEKFHPNDHQRITRALEVYEQTGILLSKHQTRKTDPESLITEVHPLYIGIVRERDELYRRIDERVNRMMEMGFLEEVEGLLQRGYSPELEAFKSVGYREMIRYMNGEISKEEAVSLTKRNTRRFAKRQMTWFRGMGELEWITLEDEFNLEETAKKVADRISDFFRMNRAI